MDLPTCPACGQSVLDDDAETCPFCGAAMDGSSGPTKKTAKPAAPSKTDTPKPGTAAVSSSPAQPAARKVKSARELAAADVDMSFDTDSAPAARGAIKSAPRRTKSRTLRVVCPMCDTPGFIPPTAVGKTVRCANEDCMVPLFTAPDPDVASQRRHAHTSEKAIRQEEQIAGVPKTRSPMALYAVIGAVLLLLATGLKLFLDRDPGISDELSRPLEIVPINESASSTDGDNGDAPTTSGTSESTAATGSPAAIIEGLIPSYQAACVQKSRDKALCRREKADALLRIGKPKEAEKEFDQLKAVSERREPSDYYQIEPRLRQYWKTVHAGDADAAKTALELAENDGDTIPAKGVLAIRASIALAAALINDSTPEKAVALLQRHDHDETIRSERDALDRSAWMALTVALNEAGIASPSPLATRSWNDPLATVTAILLATHGQIDRAVAWAAQQPDSVIQADTLAAIARYAPPSASQSLIEAAASVDPETGLRIRSILNASSADQLAPLATELLSESASEPAELPDAGTMMDLRPGDLSLARRSAAALADFAGVAASQQRDDDAVKAIQQLFGELTREIAPTAIVRSASTAMDRSESHVEDLIRTHLGLPASRRVDNEVHSYRKGLDRLGQAAEERRLYLVQLLSAIAETDGGRTLRQALEENETLAEELQVDPLAQFVAAAAKLGGGDIPSLAEVTQTTVPRGERINGLEEEEIAPVWFDVVESGGTNDALAQLEAIHSLPGLRSDLIQRLLQQRAIVGDVAVLNTIADLENSVTRENTLWSAALWLTRRDQRPAVETWLESARLPATERVLAMSGLISGLSDDD